MRVNDKIAITGHLLIRVFGPDGKLKDERDVPNLVVNTGKQWIAERMDDNPPSGMTHMAIGTSGTSPVVGNTTLGSESARVAVDSSVYSGQKETFTATFGAGVGTAALQEAGIFDSASSGVLLSRVT